MGDSVGMGAPITPATAVDHRLYSSAAISPSQGRSDHGSAGVTEEPPTHLALGTVIEAIVRTPAGNKGPEAGTHLQLRVVAPTATESDLITGTVVNVVGNETLVATPIGLLALQRRLTLASGSAIAFVVIATALPVGDDESAPARTGGWLALEEALLALLGPSPALAEQLRAELTPRSGSELAGTLLYFVSTLHQGNWPGPAIANALATSGHAKLVKRLAEDIAALRRLSEDQTTGDWRVLTLPLLLGNFPLPVRLYLSRRRATPEEGTRFALEVELSHLGPLQLDGLLRGNRLILVLRSHRTLPLGLRETLKSVFQTSLAGSGLVGDLSFATAATFLVRPLDQMREHVQIIA